jgi:hypothetical protein
MFDPTDPANLTPQQRLEELTALLARGVRRALALRLPNLSDSAQNSLDVSGERRLHVSRPVNANREQTRS